MLRTSNFAKKKLTQAFAFFIIFASRVFINNFPKGGSDGKEEKEKSDKEKSYKEKESEESEKEKIVAFDFVIKKPPGPSRGGFFYADLQAVALSITQRRDLLLFVFDAAFFPRHFFLLLHLLLLESFYDGSNCLTLKDEIFQHDLIDWVWGANRVIGTFVRKIAD